MAGYELDVAKLKVREKQDWAVGMDVFLAFPYLLTKINLDAGVLGIPDVDHLIKRRNNINLGLIYDVANPISKAINMGAIIIR